MTTKMAKMTKRVAKGYAYMNDVSPGWQSDIDLDRFKLDEAACCIIGSVFGDYDDGIARLGLSDVDSAKMGFVVEPYNLREYSILQEIWIFMLKHDPDL